MSKTHCAIVNDTQMHANFICTNYTKNLHRLFWKQQYNDEFARRENSQILTQPLSKKLKG